MTVVAITHAESELPRYFLPEDLNRLRAAGTVRVLGNNKFAAIRDQLGDVDILLGSWGMPKLTSDLLAAAPKLRAVCYAAGSVKTFVTDESYARNVAITTAMHANAIPVAQWTVALITLVNKGYFAARRLVSQEGTTGWRHHEERPFPGNFRSTKVGIVGFGAIGRLVTQGCLDLGLSVLIADPVAKTADITAAGAQHLPLREVAQQSHVLSLHAPNIPACEGMINHDVFAAMPEGSTFINTARGKIVDEAALIAALQTGRIDAHLDVTFPEPPAVDSPLWSLPNCYLTPHRAGSAAAEICRMGAYAIDECLAVIHDKPMRFPVSQAMLATMA